MMLTMHMVFRADVLPTYIIVIQYFTRNTTTYSHLQRLEEGLSSYCKHWRVTALKNIIVNANALKYFWIKSFITLVPYMMHVSWIFDGKFALAGDLEYTLLDQFCEKKFELFFSG